MNNNTKNNNNNIIPEIIYVNACADKSKILKENINRSGIYRWINKINGKSYIGSSVSLSSELSIYYYLSTLKRKKGSIIIYRALLKYGYSNFSLSILEYCESNVLIEREEYYINLLKPKYNMKNFYSNT
jgi:group I intron endonuclease